MESDQLLALWKNLSELDELNEALEMVAAHLDTVCDFDGIMVRRFDASSNTMETIAEFVQSGQTTKKTKQNALSSDGVAYLLSDKLNGNVFFHSVVNQSRVVESVDHILRKKNGTRDGKPSNMKELGKRDHGPKDAAIRGDQSSLMTLGMIPSDFQYNAIGVLCGGVSSVRGVLVVYAKRPQLLRSEARTVLAKLAGPLSMVFRNHERIHSLSALKEAAETDRDQLLIRYGRAEIGDVVIGAQKGLKNVMDRVHIVANSDLPVLIFGETGSGKEVIARAIHQQSKRNGLPFIRVNCGAIPPDLIDSELFGHERGSFTGAIDSRQGWFERADRGTLFLDEIGELPLAAQVRLLRVLQDGSFERIGGTSQRTCDVRIIAATHRNLVEMISKGMFREDLWYRLSAFPLYLPALRDRKEDIPELANHFITKAAQRFGLPVCRATQQDINLLLQYSWPGNVRELSTVIDRATILGKGKELKIESALGTFDHASSNGLSLQDKQRTIQTDSENQTLDQMIIAHIRSVLEKTNGIVDGGQGAASILGLNPNTLRSKMRKYGIRTHPFKKV